MAEDLKLWRRFYSRLQLFEEGFSSAYRVHPHCHEPYPGFRKTLSYPLIRGLPLHKQPEINLEDCYAGLRIQATDGTDDTFRFSLRGTQIGQHLVLPKTLGICSGVLGGVGALYRSQGPVFIEGEYPEELAEKVLRPIEATWNSLREERRRALDPAQ